MEGERHASEPAPSDEGRRDSGCSSRIEVATGLSGPVDPLTQKHLTN